MTAIAQELSQAVGIARACQALGLPRSRLYPHQQAVGSSRPTPAHTLSSEERGQVRVMLYSERFRDLPPRQVYAVLLGRRPLSVPLAHDVSHSGGAR